MLMLRFGKCAKQQTSSFSGEAQRRPENLVSTVRLGPRVSLREPEDDSLVGWDLIFASA